VKKWDHPVTGEPIGLGQHISWSIQGMIRRWPFIIILTCISLVCWFIGWRHAVVLGWWNAWASYMALFIESVVGISMFQQTKADAQVIRKILAMETSQFEELKDLIVQVEDTLETIEIVHSEDHYEPIEDNE